MKSTAKFFAGLSLLLISSTALWAFPDNLSNSPLKEMTGDTVKIFSSPSLIPLARIWKDEYSRLNPGVPFLMNSADKAAPAGNNSIFFLTGDQEDLTGIELDWKIVIGHNAIVPFINEKNPMSEKIAVSGITDKKLAALLDSKEIISWNNLTDDGMNVPASLFVPGNGAIIESVRNFTGYGNEIAESFVLENPQAVITSVQKDIYSIGFCRLSDLMNEKGELLQGINLLPIDKNGNGRVDSFESIYSSPVSLIRGIWIGKYPHELCGSIVAASGEKPEGENLTAFLSWVTTRGGDYLAMYGYSDIASVEKNLNLASLNAAETETVAAAPKSASELLILFSLIVAAGIIIAVVFRSRSKNKNVSRTAIAKSISVLNEKSIHAPAGLYFDKTHTWAFMEKDGIVRVGIDDFMQHLTGTITRIVMREPGEYVRRGEKIVTVIQEGKQLNLYAPISGKIISQNTDLYLDSSLLNISPYSDGWIYLIEPGNWVREIQFMFMADKFGEWIRNEFVSGISLPHRSGLHRRYMLML
jgi:glycine cleavage system H lipoate-binding protein/ABC-type phosphate transport system substrate-binding protein